MFGVLSVGTACWALEILFMLNRWMSSWRDGWCPERRRESETRTFIGLFDCEYMSEETNVRVTLCQPAGLGSPALQNQFAQKVQHSCMWSPHANWEGVNDNRWIDRKIDRKGECTYPYAGHTTVFCRRESAVASNEWDTVDKDHVSSDVNTWYISVCYTNFYTWSLW